jgi:hypothetical protein
MTVTGDRSNYWTPVLYWINDDSSFTAMTADTRISYKLRNATGPITGFPPGLRMVSGLPVYRDAGAVQSHGVRLTLDTDMNISTNELYLPNGTTYPAPPADYVQMTIIFPNCGWANQSLDAWDHFSHMSWPVHAGDWQMDAGTYPESHPVNYPQIVIEASFYLEPWMKAEYKAATLNFAISNGDTTGVTWHGGFVSVWNTSVLQAAIDHCHDVGDALGDCYAFAGLLRDDLDESAQDCRIQTQIPSEEVGLYRAIDRLPGCNPLWDSDGPAAKPTHCPWYITPGWTGPNLQFMSWQAAYRPPLVLPGVDTRNVSHLHPVSGHL